MPASEISISGRSTRSFRMPLTSLSQVIDFQVQLGWRCQPLFWRMWFGGRIPFLAGPRTPGTLHTRAMKKYDDGDVMGMMGTCGYHVSENIMFRVVTSWGYAFAWSRSAPKLHICVCVFLSLVHLIPVAISTQAELAKGIERELCLPSTAWRPYISHGATPPWQHKVPLRL
jgi:hypothetical protein